MESNLLNEWEYTGGTYGNILGDPIRIYFEEPMGIDLGNLWAYIGGTYGNILGEPIGIYFGGPMGISLGENICSARIK